MNVDGGYLLWFTLAYFSKVVFFSAIITYLPERWALCGAVTTRASTISARGGCFAGRFLGVCIEADLFFVTDVVFVGFVG